MYVDVFIHLLPVEDTRRIDCMQMFYTLIICKDTRRIDCMQMFYTLITCRTQEGWTVCRCFIHLLSEGHKKDRLYVDVLYTYYLQDTRRMDCMQMFYTLIICRTQEGWTVCRCFIHLLPAGHKKDRLYVLTVGHKKDDCMQMFYTLITCRTQEGLTVCRCFIHLLPAGHKKDRLYVDVLYTYYLFQDTRRIDCMQMLLIMQMFYTLIICRTQEGCMTCIGHKKDGLYVDVLYTYYLQDTRRIDCMQMFLYTYYLQDTRRMDCMQMFYTFITCRTQEGLTVCRCFIHLLPVGHKKD